MFSIIFTCVEIICEMKGDDYENKRMILRETCYCILLIMKIKDNKIGKPEGLPKLNMKLEGCLILIVKAEGAFLVK